MKIGKENLTTVCKRIDKIIRTIAEIETQGCKNSLVYISQNINDDSITFVFENHFYGRNPIGESYEIPLDIIIADDWIVLLKKYLEDLEQKRIDYFNSVDSDEYELYQKLKQKFEKS